MNLQDHIKKAIATYSRPITEYRIRYELDGNTLIVSTDGCLEHFEVDVSCPDSIRVYSVSNYQTGGDDQLLDIGNQLLETIYIDIC